MTSSIEVIIKPTQASIDVPMGDTCQRHYVNGKMGTVPIFPLT